MLRRAGQSTSELKRRAALHVSDLRRICTVAAADESRNARRVPAAARSVQRRLAARGVHAESNGRRLHLERVRASADDAVVLDDFARCHQQRGGVRTVAQEHLDARLSANLCSDVKWCAALLIS